MSKVRVIFLSASIVLVLAGCTAANPLSLTAEAASTALASASTPTNEAPVYRFYNPTTGEHFFTLSQDEGLNAGFNLEGVGFNVFISADTQGTVPLYRCYNDSKHFISLDHGCEGSTTEGMYGYIYSQPNANNTDLSRFFLPSNGDFLESTNLAEGPNDGYELEGNIGYVPIN